MKKFIPYKPSKILHTLIDKVWLSILRSIEYSEDKIIACSTVGLLGYPLLYILWDYVFPQSYENLPMRLIGSVLCLFLVLKDYWPRRLKRFLPIYWYLTILYCLPFFFGFFVLKNNWSVIAVMSMLISVFILVLLVDWLSLNILFFAGSGAACLVYWISNDTGEPPTIYLQYVIVYLFAILAGSLFNYKTNMLKREKLTAMSLIGSSIAHELRTPLLGIKSGSLGIKRYLPILFEAYNRAREQGLDVPKIRTAHYNSLLPALERIETETNNANTIIDMLLMNVGRQTIDPALFDYCSMRSCIDEALSRYPFSSTEERSKVFWKADQEFIFKGSKLLMVHVVFNLIKNALHFIAKAHKGTIHIWIDEGETYNTLYFKDTGRGIPADVLPRIFERFFTTTLTGTGVGLSFCRFVIDSFGGNIECHSVYGSYTEYRLQFPKCHEVSATISTNQLMPNQQFS